MFMVIWVDIFVLIAIGIAEEIQKLQRWDSFSGDGINTGHDGIGGLEDETDIDSSSSIFNLTLLNLSFSITMTLCIHHSDMFRKENDR